MHLLPESILLFYLLFDLEQANFSDSFLSSVKMEIVVVYIVQRMAVKIKQDYAYERLHVMSRVAILNVGFQDTFLFSYKFLRISKSFVYVGCKT